MDIQTSATPFRVIVSNIFSTQKRIRTIFSKGGNLVENVLHYQDRNIIIVEPFH
jgi:hypothetical protein